MGSEFYRVGIVGILSPDFVASSGIGGILSSGISGFSNSGIGEFSKPRSEFSLFTLQ